MSKIQKKNIFSENPWNDTPYYDMFLEEWKKFGIIDTNHWYAIYEKNKVSEHHRFFESSIFKWPERI